jgi:OOP family OmpA-OmpF porin
MRSSNTFFVVLAFALAATCVFVRAVEAQGNPATELARDLPGTADHPLTGRYEGAVILSQTRQAFDEIALPAGAARGPRGEGGLERSVAAQGRVTRTLYIAPAGRSSLEVMTNHRDALAQRGFEPVFECARDACGAGFTGLKYRWDNPASHVRPGELPSGRSLMIADAYADVVDPRYALMRRAEDGGRETLVAVFMAINQIRGRGEWLGALAGRPVVLVEVVEPRAMERRIVTIGAPEIASRLQAEGRVAFYGIFFDFDKAEVKPESEPQIAEMAAFLRQNPQARAFVIGHTDGRGALDYNLGLSQRRAEAVVRALAQRHGIGTQRLTGRGLGPLAPLASNREEEGRARNRRVELVEQQP